MKVIIACEESQAVCIEFRKLGHEAFSCDIQDCSGGHPEWHIKGDCLEAINLKEWDLMIAHPPCTYLSNAGIGWFNEEKYGDKAKERKKERIKGLEFFMKLWNCKIPKICIENPTGWANSHFRKPDQIIQPWQFGDTESKRTCLWLKNLPLLDHCKEPNLFCDKPTHVKPKIYGYYKTGNKKGCPIYGNSYLQFSEDRGKIRSKTYLGIAKAFATQYGGDLTF